MVRFSSVHGAEKGELPEFDDLYGSEDYSESYSYCSSGSDDIPVPSSQQIVRSARQREQAKARQISSALVRKVLEKQQQQRSPRNGAKDRRRGDKSRIMKRHRLHRAVSTGSQECTHPEVPDETASEGQQWCIDTPNQHAEPSATELQRVELLGRLNSSETVFRTSRRARRTSKKPLESDGQKQRSRPGRTKSTSFSRHTSSKDEQGRDDALN